MTWVINKQNYKKKRAFVIFSSSISLSSYKFWTVPATVAQKTLRLAVYEFIMQRHYGIMLHL